MSASVPYNALRKQRSGRSGDKGDCHCAFGGGAIGDSLTRAVTGIRHSLQAADH